MQGEASELGKKFATQAMPKRSCFIYGGETTVTGGGGGEGGRNQELALSALIHVPVGRVVVAAASDGWDNGNIAGAIADASLRETAEHLGMPAQKYLQEHNSHSFWDNMSGAIRTGKTGTNVADFCIILSH
jgi:glycerate-2-kinase